MQIFDGQSRGFIKMYLIIFESLALISMLSMVALFVATLTPASSAAYFVDVVSADIFEIIGKNTF